MYKPNLMNAKKPDYNHKSKVNNLVFKLVGVNTFNEAVNVLRQYSMSVKIDAFLCLCKSTSRDTSHLRLRSTAKEINNLKYQKVWHLLSTKELNAFGVNPAPASRSRPSFFADKMNDEMVLDNAIYSLLVAESFIKEIKQHNEDIRAGKEFCFRLLEPDAL